MNLYGFAGGDPINFSDPLGLCPLDKPECQWIKAALIAAGTDIGTILGGGAGLLTGPGAVVATPAGALGGAAAGAGLGFAAGQLIDHVFFSKSDGGGKGSEFRGGKQSQRDPDHARLMKEFNPTRAQRTRIHEEIAKQKKGGGDLGYDDLRQIFTDVVGKKPK